MNIRNLLNLATLNILNPIQRSLNVSPTQIPFPKNILPNLANLKPDDKQLALNEYIRNAESHLETPAKFEPCLHYFLANSNENAATNYLLEKINVFFMKSDHSLYSEFMRALRNIYPNIDKLIAVGMYDSVVTLTLKHEGVLSIIDYLKEKGSLPSEFNFSLHTTSDSFVNDVYQFMTDEKSQSEKYFIKYDGTHYIPIYIHKEADKYEIYIIDSLGRSGWDEIVLSSLDDQRFKMFNENTTVYTCGVQRQFAGKGCAVFSLRTLVEIVRKPNEFINLAKENSEKLNGYRKNHFSPQQNLFNMLPASMMKPTQSLSKISEFIKNQKSSCGQLPTRKTVSGFETLQENIERHTSKESKPRNTHALTRLEKYTKIALTRMIKTQTSST